ncbi:hypothetical protein [Pimelobacter simplex]|nr:hypothetical protein [Pimelobacter simplex]UUW88479.1 hypothetical protein M0M43_22430 [Pimelobacter simplex]UUW97983.1 hypothetical protein M0M48_11075 [Pimelobacter simplex]
MNAVRVALELPVIVLGPMLCRLRGHRWHAWQNHAAPTLRICIRCGRTT